MSGSEAAIGQKPITENPFSTSRLIFSIKPDLANQQLAFDYASHLHTLKAVRDQTEKRVSLIKTQVEQDKQEFRELLELRKKYQLAALSKDPLLASKSSAIAGDRLFVITLDFQNPKPALAKAALKEIEALQSHSLMLEVQLMKKVIVHAVAKNDSCLSLHFHPRLKQLSARPLTVGVNL